MAGVLFSYQLIVSGISVDFGLNALDFDISLLSLLSNANTDELVL